ncbi:MAG: tetratricopeptide repeat protein [Acidimicrobiia bacterium]
MAIDVTDATFQTEVIERSMTTPVVVDLWAPWCGPCTTLGPIIERVIAATNGAVALAKVNVDENPQIAGAFQVQSIPAVFAVHRGAVVNSFIGALPEHEVQRFVATLGPSEEELALQRLIDAGDEASLRSALETAPGNETVVVKLAELLIADGRGEEALAVLARVPETDAVRRVAAAARLSTNPDDDYDTKLVSLLDQVKSDEAARQEYVDILELMGPDDPRTAGYRKQLTSRLF